VPLISELESGHIDHALALDLPINCSLYNSWPAQRDDGWSTSGCVPEGAHFRINPSVNLSALHLSAFALMMATAAQKYGIIVRDSTATEPRFYVEDPTQYGTNPYTGAGGLFDGLSGSAVMNNFPWANLQLLTMNEHTSGKSVATTTTVAVPTPPLTAGQQVSVSAKVAVAGGGAAIGAAYLQDSGKTIATAILSGGSATLSATLSSLGQHALTVVYGGDENAKASTASATVTVTAAVQDALVPTATPPPPPTASQTPSHGAPATPAEAVAALISKLSGVAASGVLASTASSGGNSPSHDGHSSRASTAQASSYLWIVILGILALGGGLIIKRTRGKRGPAEQNV
jgi:hypothetical protein